MEFKDNLIKATTHPSISCYIEESKKRCGRFELIELFKQERPRLSQCNCDTPTNTGFYHRWDSKTADECNMWRIRLRLLIDFLGTY